MVWAGSVGDRPELGVGDVAFEDTHVLGLTPSDQIKAVNMFASGWQQAAERAPRLRRRPLGEFRAYAHRNDDYYGLSFAEDRTLDRNRIELNKPALDAKDEPSWYERTIGYAVTYSRTGIDTVRHEFGHALLSDYTQDAADRGLSLRMRLYRYHTTIDREQWRIWLGENAAKDWLEMIADAFSAWSDPRARATLPDELIALLEELVK